MEHRELYVTAQVQAQLGELPSATQTLDRLLGSGTGLTPGRRTERDQSQFFSSLLSHRRSARAYLSLGAFILISDTYFLSPKSKHLLQSV